ncbi:hypothetical protein [Carboxylicivirga sp. M1479]|uniref:hypothetical protein n=1 Tax=Carboxylicivirga sp. M1479 TaxID=2594476 RepID=UPI0011786A27|nr:hypothetical protein [Carboxylicivirga sp. M1479]TRX70524.1 hypothetical protein FNN09_11135 [Carboxylicivirga sp. M1479]
MGTIVKLLKKWWWVLLLPFVLLLKPWDWLSSRVNRSFYEKVANACYEAMTIYGTKEDVLLNQLSELSKSELIGVYDAFGARYYSNHLGIGVPNTDLLGSALDLFGWFSHELERKEKSQMRDIWLKSGLKLTF